MISTWDFAGAEKIVRGAVAIAPDLDVDLSARRRMFHRVVKEIGTHLLEPHPIPMDHEIGADVGDKADPFRLRYFPV